GQVPPHHLVSAYQLTLASVPEFALERVDPVAILRLVDREPFTSETIPHLLRFADALAHTVDRSASIDIHRWLDEIGEGMLRLRPQEMRNICLETTTRLGRDHHDAQSGSEVIGPGQDVSLPDALLDTPGAIVIPASVALPTPVPLDVRLIWGGVPIRNADFIGREALLRELREALLQQSKASVLPKALHGLGGVGKTQLAVEYVYRYASDYDLVWWVPAEQPSLVRASLATLGDRLGLPASQDMQQTAVTVLDALGASPLHWLLVYDNADRPEDLTPLLPSAGGHVIITSRNQEWATVLVRNAIEVDVFERSESIELLRRRGGEISVEDATRLAAKLGDLPLALEQAAIWQSATGMPVREYLDIFESHVKELMEEGKPTSDPSAVYAFLAVALDRLRAESAAAAQLFDLFAFLGAEPVPASLLRAGQLPDPTSPLSQALRDSIRLHRAIRELRRYGLAKVDPNSQRMQVHRLVQRVMREDLRADRRRQALANVRHLLAYANPGEPEEPANWSRYAEIRPHVAAAELIHAPDDKARQVVLDQARYLFQAGDYEGSRELIEPAVAAWSAPDSKGGLGPDHVQTLVARLWLANALRLLGESRRARELDEETLARMRRHPQLGPDHEYTLQATDQLAVDTRVAGEFIRARELDEENVQRHLRVFGPGDQKTLIVRNNLAVNLRMLGDFQGAYDIDRDVVSRWREMLGENDVRTLFSISNLARDLYGLGRYTRALDLQSRTYPMMVERLGMRHNDVLLAGRTIAIALRKVGRYDEALQQAKENYRNYQTRFGDDHEHTLAATMSYANTLRVVGALSQAQSLALDAVERYRRVFGARHPLTLAAQVNLGIIHRAVGDVRAASDLDRKTLDRLQRSLGARHPYTLCAAVGLANDLVLQHGLAEARVLSQRTLDTSREVRGEHHPYTLACAVNAAFDLQAVGEAGQDQLDRAISALRDVLGEAHPEVLDAD
ncbi:MAG TPA: FxSxx-COOH system tetratricopeptide repeat protein, partial [Gemmatimonadales bacterium]|nr:FxSxx-COOH system tetratricopeptide repeat protein [Gemmatimonadales bacterium]